MKNQIKLLLLLLFLTRVAKGQSFNTKIEKEKLIKTAKAWSLAARMKCNPVCCTIEFDIPK